MTPALWNSLGPLVGSEALAVVIKATAILGAAALLASALRRRSAAGRHLVWLLALAGVLALPLLAPAPRPIRVETPFWPTSSRQVIDGADGTSRPLALESAPPSVHESTSTLEAGATAPPVTPVPESPTRWSALAWVALGWLAGAIAVLAWHVVGWVGLASLVRSASREVHPRWHWIVGECARRAGVRGTIELRKSAAVGSPLVCGIGRSIIVLPWDADEWPEDRRRAVALHEVAHVARHDASVQLLAALACAVYWFHPGVWAAARCMRAESERACDDRVVGLGFPAAEYAAHLLEITRKARGLRVTGAVAIGMARRSTLEGRLLSLLDAGRRRGALSARSRVAAVTLFALTLLALAGLRPVARATESASEPPSSSEPSAASEPTAASEPAVASDELLASNSSRSRHSSDEGIPYDGQFDVRPGGRLTLRLGTGASVVIRGWNQRRVEIQGHVAGPNQDDVAVAMHGSGDEVSLRLKPKGTHSGNFSTSAEFQIRVPRRFDVEIRSSGGGITIEDVEGDFRGSTGGGEIRLRSVQGNTSLSTGGGDVEVSDSHLTGRVSTGDGLVRISRVRGGLRGSSGSGPVIYAEAGEKGAAGDLDGIEVDRSHTTITYADPEPLVDAKGPNVLHVEKAGGDIHLPEAPYGARVNTGGGTVKIGRTAGAVRATTGGGDMELGPVAGSISASTGAGKVSVKLSGRDVGRTVDLTSGYGDIILEVPAGLGVELDLETSYTRASRPSHIRSDIPVEIEAATGWDDSEGTPRKYVRANATSGSGKVHVRIKTVNGNIEIRRPGR